MFHGNNPVAAVFGSMSVPQTLNIVSVYLYIHLVVVFLTPVKPSTANFESIIPHTTT